MYETGIYTLHIINNKGSLLYNEQKYIQSLKRVAPL